ncbi:hypothetical protein [Microbacterium sp. AR7-10]|uniref:hypothetical protein n=1 Tax=Microbacterium sp. AR7-10 TaxID=1891970 RepID=UPI0008FCB0F0|nr:hypothetical protein [Microbacterium sp. AR7-10]OIU84609.1 hypothetical protein BFN01_02140 [Microbacterium sp. AR7-10]
MRAAPGTYDLSIYAGDTYAARFAFTVEGQPFPLPATGWRAQARPNPHSETVIELTVDATEAAGGIITLTIPAAETEGIGFPKGVWDLQHADGLNISTWISGRVTIEKDVTR